MLIIHQRSQVWQLYSFHIVKIANIFAILTLYTFKQWRDVYALKLIRSIGLAKPSTYN